MAIKAVVFDFLGVLYDHTPGKYNNDLADVIRELKAHCKVGLLSNAPSKDMLLDYLRRGDMDDLFDIVVASGETPFVKPQREIFEHMAAAFDAQCSELLFFDDSPGHIEAAKTYGLQAFQYRTTQEVKEILARYV